MPPNEDDANPNNLRIVSLIPSATDICVHLGLGENIVGITHCCDREGLSENVVVVTEDQIHASVTSQGEIHEKVVANGKKAQAVLEGEELCSLTTDEIPTLYPINKSLLKQIQPTLIVTQDLCHVCAPSSQTVLMALKEAGIDNATIVLLTPMNLWDVVANLQQVADAAGISTRGKLLCDELSTNLHTLKSIIRNHKQRKRTGNKQPKKLLVMEWVDPPFCGGHWIPDMAQLIDTKLAIEPTPEGRSRQISWQEIYDSQPDVTIVACCGFDLERCLNDGNKASDQFETLLSQNKSAKLFAANGDQYFARPSPKLLVGTVIMALCAYHDEPELIEAILELPFARRAVGSYEAMKLNTTSSIQTCDTKTTTITTPHPFTRLQNPNRWEQIRMILGLLSGFVILRFVALLLILFVGGPIVVLLYHQKCRSLCVYTLRFVCRCLLFVAGHFWITVRQDTKDSIFEPGKCPKIIVSNHISNMEILHLLTLPFCDPDGNPVCPYFVTKASIFGLPVVGTITRDVLGSIGVERKNRDNESNNDGPPPKSVTEQIVEAVAHNNNDLHRGPLVIFPEGTTTNGTCLLSFKTGAFCPMVPVQPILYSFGKGAYDTRSSSFLPTYESIWGPAYLWRLLCQLFHPLDCRILTSIDPPPKATASKDRPATEAFAQLVRSEMARKGDLPMLSDTYNYKHKLFYHGKLRDAFVGHPKGPKYAMCFAPMQKVLASDNNSEDYDLVSGTKFVTESNGTTPSTTNKEKKDL